MEIQLNDYHKKVNAQMQKSMAYWREHPLSLEECLAQFKRLREQRNVRQTLLVVPQCLSSCQLSKHSEGIEYSPIYLVRFFRNLLLKDSWVLKNRYLHIRPTDDWKEQPRIGTPQVPRKQSSSTPQVQSTCGDSYSIL